MNKNPIRVLLVDDDADERIIVGDLLRVASVEVFELSWAATYEQGLQSVIAGSCDVCLVDYRLGARSGLELLKEITSQRNHPQVILMTGEGGREVDLAAAKAGAADYLVKRELTAALLERSIRYALERGFNLNILQDASELRSLNLAKTAFLAAMSHEMHTPMNAILGMAEMLCKSPLNTEQLEYTNALRRAGSSLLALINNVLDLTKIETGQLKLERVVFDLKELLDQVIEWKSPKARAKGLVLMSRLTPCLPVSLIGDPTRLRQVLTNLIDNAIKFTDSGEIVLSAGGCESGKPGQIEFAVSDTRVGIATEKFATISEEFGQTDLSPKSQFYGAGLGLGISRRLVQAMGGEISVSSLAGKGSTFRFTVQFDPVPENAPSVRVAMSDLHTKRALLIDDHPTSNVILSESLRAWGLQSDSFRLVEEALPSLSASVDNGRPYAVAIIGVSGQLNTDGFDAAAAVRSLSPSIPIVMLTSNPKPGDAARSRQSGVSGYAVKPVPRAHLLRLVCDAIESHPVPEPRLAIVVEEKAERRKELAETARILVVDDSPDNRLLVQVYLKGSPYVATYEEDGKAGLDRFAAEDFDLVLMDLQMPVMDGIAATRAIRELEKERGKTPVPIVALSANASLQDTEATRNAGCNAHLSKPISKQDLLANIEKHSRPDSPIEQQVAGRRPPVKVEMTPGLEAIIPSYLARRRKEVPELRDLLAAANFTRLAILGHNLKGSGGGYGFPELTRLGAWLEQSAKQKDTGSLHERIGELGEYLEQVELTAKC